MSIPPLCLTCARRVGGECLAYNAFLADCPSHTIDRLAVVEGLLDVARYARMHGNTYARQRAREDAELVMAHARVSNA